MKHSRPLFLAILLAGLTAGLSSCRARSANSDIVLKPAYGVLEDLFQTEIVNIGLEELGYRVVSGSEVEYDIVNEAVAKGYLDYTASFWNPNQSEFYEANGGDAVMVKAGTLVKDALQGYVIDRATAEKYEISNIEQLKDPQLAALFDSDGDGKANLVGCGPGWACQKVTDYHLDAYELRDTVEFDSGNYFGLIDEVIKRYEAGKPVLYYTWTPFWLNFVLTPGKDVEWLEVPFTALPEGQGEAVETVVEGKNLGFAINQLDIVANKAFLNKHPTIERFFEVVEIPNEAVSLQNQKMRNGENTPTAIRVHAEEWISENKELFDSWIAAAK